MRINLVNLCFFLLDEKYKWYNINKFDIQIFILIFFTEFNFELLWLLFLSFYTLGGYSLAPVTFYLLYNSEFIGCLVNQHIPYPVEQFPGYLYDHYFTVFSFHLFLEIKRHCRICTFSCPCTFNKIASELPGKFCKWRKEEHRERICNRRLHKAPHVAAINCLQMVNKGVSHANEAY